MTIAESIEMRRRRHEELFAERQRKSEKERQLDEALEDSFPASDPVAPAATTTSGAPRNRETPSDE